MKRRISSGIAGAVRRKLLIAAGALAAIVAAYLVVCDFVLSSILSPDRVLPEETPCDAGRAAKAITFESVGDRIPLKGCLLPSSGDRAIVLVHGVDSHGWAGGHPDIARAYVEAGFHVLVFDLRGHGRSSGDRIGLGWHERRDVRAAVNLLLERGFEPGRIGIHGTSYGAAVALLSAAAIPEIGAVVADSAFADVWDVMDGEIVKRTGLPAWFVRHVLLPGLGLMAKLHYGLDFDAITPERAVPKIAPRPILFIHGSDDPVIPLAHAHRLKAASKNAADELWILEGLGHTEGVRMEALQKEVSPMREAFLRKVTAFFDHALR